MAAHFATTLRMKMIRVTALVLVLWSAACAPFNSGLLETATPAASPIPETRIPSEAPVPATDVPSLTPSPTLTLTPSATPTQTLTPTPTTQVAVVKPDSVVRRLNSGVFAGDSQPLKALNSNDPVSLGPNGLVTTDKSGEAEVLIKDCLKLFIFQATALTRSTCRKSDAASGLGVCGTQGLTGVVNSCTSQVEIQSPSSTVVSKGTWFTVMYLPEDQLTIVQVFEDRVEVQALINSSTGQRSSAQNIPAGSLWFTAPGANPPSINGIRGRTVQPMSVWEALRPVLVQKYPNIDLWMNTAAKQAKTSKLNFDNSLVHPTGEINVSFLGKPWEDKRLQEAMLSGIDWKGLNQNLWFGTTVTTQIKFNTQPASDLSKVSFDIAKAQLQLGQAGYYQNAKLNVVIVAPQGDSNALFFGDALVSSLSELNLNPVLQAISDAEIKKLLQGAAAANTALISLGTSGDAFRTTPTP